MPNDVVISREIEEEISALEMHIRCSSQMTVDHLEKIRKAINALNADKTTRLIGINNHKGSMDGVLVNSGVVFVFQNETAVEQLANIKALLLPQNLP